MKSHYKKKVGRAAPRRLVRGAASRRRTVLRRRARRQKAHTSSKSTASGALQLAKSSHNPVLTPRRAHAWESYQTFNAAAIFEDGKIHLFYRALGEDGVSRIGYAASKDGEHIEERLDTPVYAWRNGVLSDVVPSNYISPYISGGGLGGAEDPRITKLGDRLYMTYVAFDGYQLPRIALTSIALEDFLQHHWKWTKPKFISSPYLITKSACILPEKINGKYVVFHRVFPDILIDFVDTLDFKEGEYLKGQFRIRARKNFWDSRKIGAGAPPIKTKEGWLLIYYGVDDRDASQYKIGAMMLDLKNPIHVLARTDYPILEPQEWYENQGHKAGIAYPCGAVLVGEKLFVYYGGADTVVCLATADLKKFVAALMKGGRPRLQRASLAGSR